MQTCSHTANCNNLNIKSPTRGSLDNFMKASKIGGTFNQFLPFLLLEPSDYRFTTHSEQELPSIGVRRSLSNMTLQWQCELLKCKDVMLSRYEMLSYLQTSKNFLTVYDFICFLRSLSCSSLLIADQEICSRNRCLLAFNKWITVL